VKIGSNFDWEPLTQEQFNMSMQDFAEFCRHSKIINKQGEPVTWELNEPQKVIANKLFENIFTDDPKPKTIFIHKSRQMGASVLLSKAEEYILTRKRNFSIMHMHITEDDAVKFLEDKAIPIIQGTHNDLLPQVRRRDRTLYFEKFGDTELKSSVNFPSSMTKGAARGQTNQVVILDEYAYYNRVKHIESGVIPSMSKIGSSLLVYVTTANGMNHAYDLWKASQAPESKVEYVFLPWHMMSEYEMEPEGRLKDLTELTDYEIKLCEIFEAHDYPIESWTRKMQWYQYVLWNDHKGDQSIMFKDYPSTPQESFSASGSPVLNDIILSKWLEKDIEPTLHEATIEDGKPVIKESEFGNIRIFNHPQPGRKYLIGVDPAMNMEGSDNSGMMVVDKESLQVMATFRDSIEQTDLAELSIALANYYNRAFIVPERNMSESYINWLTHSGYYNIYIDPIATTSKKIVYGVRMTLPLRTSLMDSLKIIVVNEAIKVYDKQWIDEAMHLQYKKTPNGTARIEAGPESGDDLIFASLMVISQLDLKRIPLKNTL